MTDELVKIMLAALKNIKNEHGDELLKIASHYGPAAADKILEMLYGDSEVGSKIYYDALEEMSAGDLLDSAISDFQQARKDKEEFKRFLVGLGTGLGIVIKTLLKSVSPI